MIKKYERGAVSIFVVIFAALLITVVTISFLRLMTQSNRESSVLDLSQSAYDAALDGVEDAKRAIATDKATVRSGSGCDQISPVLGNGSGEVIIRQDASDEALSQAYTCVTVDFTADTVEEDNVPENSSILIPLRTGGVDFDTIRIGWARTGRPHTNPAVFRTAAEGDDLPSRSSWQAETPALLRVRYISVGASINLNDDYNSVNAGEFQRAGRSFTKFLLPSEIGLESEGVSSNDTSPTQTSCASALSTRPSMTGYDCVIDLTGVPNSGTKYLQLTPLYKNADISIELLDGGVTVPFEDVQAIVDSTGRAGDVFRRVQARVRLDGTDSSATYPSDALILGGGDLCKDFVITDDVDDYDLRCTP